MRRKSSQGGFTLLEMMIAFSMTSLLFLALFSSFNTISRGWDAADRKMLKTEDMRLISEFLRSQLSQAIVVRIKGEDEPTVYAFEGDNEYVRYAAPLQPLQHQGGVYLIELGVGNDSEGKKLEMRYAPYRPDMTWEDAFEGMEPVLVYGGLSSVQFEYFAAESVDDDPRWETDWVDQTVYPLLLKLIIEDNEGQVWPELVVDLPQVDEYVRGPR